MDNEHTTGPGWELQQRHAELGRQRQSALESSIDDAANGRDPANPLDEVDFQAAVGSLRRAAAQSAADELQNFDTAVRGELARAESRAVELRGMRETAAYREAVAAAMVTVRMQGGRGLLTTLEQPALTADERAAYIDKLDDLIRAARASGPEAYQAIRWRDAALESDQQGAELRGLLKAVTETPPWVTSIKAGLQRELDRYQEPRHITLRHTAQLGAAPPSRDMFGGAPGKRR